MTSLQPQTDSKKMALKRRLSARLNGAATRYDGVCSPPSMMAVALEAPKDG
jgi:hypothetical protein